VRKVLPVFCHFLLCQCTDRWTYDTILGPPAFLCHPTSQSAYNNYKSTARAVAKHKPIRVKLQLTSLCGKLPSEQADLKSIERTHRPIEWIWHAATWQNSYCGLCDVQSCTKRINKCERSTTHSQIFLLYIRV